MVPRGGAPQFNKNNRLVAGGTVDQPAISLGFSAALSHRESWELDFTRCQASADLERLILARSRFGLARVIKDFTETVPGNQTGKAASQHASDFDPPPCGRAS